MSRKKNTKSVIITIIITLIVLGCLTYAAMQFIIPAYAKANEGAASVQTKIYETAVKLFPLLVGIVLIVIASMIANSGSDYDDEDDEDKLPPNSYDGQLFEKPSDDPASPRPVAKPEEPAKKEEFFSMFESHEKPEEKPVQEEEKPAEPVVEPVPEVIVPEPEPEPEPVPEPEPEPAPAPVVQPAASSNDSPVVDAIYALIRKLDDITDLMTVEDEEEEEEIDDQDDYEYYSEDQEEEEAEEEQPEEPASEERFSGIEKKLDRLCDLVGTLTEVVSTQAVAAYAAPVEAKPAVEAPKKPKVEKPVKEVKTVEVPVEVPVDKKLNDVNPKDPVQRARIEYESAKECFYDITYAFTKASAEKAEKALPESAYVLTIKGKTVVIVPFLDKAEAESELDKIGSKYDSVFVNADDPATFDEVIAPRL